MTLSTKRHIRYCSANGDHLPGGSTIAGLWPEGKQQLAGWMVKQANMGFDPKLVARKAAEEGTCTHYLAQCSIMSETPEMGTYPPDIVKVAKPSHKQFLKWLKNNDVITLGSELQMVSEEHRFGGTIDVLGILNGKLTVIDIKRTMAIYTSHRIQLAGYCHMTAEVLGIPVPEACIVRLNKAGTGYEALQYDNLDMEWRAFLICREIYELIPQLRARG
jgi:hypothetical protein